MNPGDWVAGKYLLEGKLGFGSMGEVWQALYARIERRFAIKFMHPHIAATDDGKERFFREARIAANVKHPNMVEVFDVGVIDNGSPYLVMELLDGSLLEDVFMQYPPLSVREFLSFMHDITLALNAAHHAKIAHRDIKPENILLHRDAATGKLVPKLLDYGLGKFIRNHSIKTHKGTLLGSPIYMSPEQVRSSVTIDTRTDLWSLGIVLFEGLTGRLPYKATNIAVLLVAVANGSTLQIDDLAPALPESVRAIVRDCLKPVEQRIETAQELAERIAKAMSDPGLEGLYLLHPDDIEDDTYPKADRTRPSRLTPVPQQATTTPPKAPSDRPAIPPQWPDAGKLASSPPSYAEAAHYADMEMPDLYPSQPSAPKGALERRPSLPAGRVPSYMNMRPLTLDDVAHLEHLLRMLTVLLSLVLGIVAVNLLAYFFLVLTRRTG